MITVSDVAKSFGARTLFEGVSLQLDAGRRYGLVGGNGSGKTTFLRMLGDRTEASEGVISRHRRLRIGMLEQDHFRFEDVPVLDVVMMGHVELWQAILEKEAVLATASEHFDADRYGAAEDIVLRYDGYSLESRAAVILEGLGIQTESHAEPLSTLSGGFKLRVLLAQALAASPDVLLLDEPTNHLDIVSIRWLETFLSAFDGLAVVISHDHRFLDNVVTHILDVDYATITAYSGGYTEFQSAKQAERERREKEIRRREQEIADHRAFVDRFRAKATKARQAQSRLKQIARIEIEPLPKSSRQYPAFRFAQVRPSGRVALTLKGVSKAFGDNAVLDDVSLEVFRADRIAIIGPNGIGKSTLLKIAVGDVQADDGTVVWGFEARPGYVAQDHRAQLGGREIELMEWLWEAMPGASVGEVRGALGAVLFSGDDAQKSVHRLSGGEAARLLFARMAMERPNVLVLDEPTNHLDLEAIESLVGAIDEYDGTVVFVSHDRWVVERLADRIVEITPDGIRDFPGNYEAYLAACGDDHLDRAPEAVQRAPRRGRAKRPSKTTPSQATDVHRLRDERDRLIERIAAAEKQVEEIHAAFAEPGFYDRPSPDHVQRLKSEEAEATALVRSLMSEWDAAEQRLAEQQHGLES